MAGLGTRYSRVAILLHWGMAIAFLFMLASGLSMGIDTLPKSFRFQLIQLHKSTGLALLALFFVRMAWRFAHKPPVLPGLFKKWERWAAHGAHGGLYAFMLALPLSGWVMVSSSSYGLPTFFYGLFEWPYIPGLAGNEIVRGASGEAHEFMAYAFMGLIALHVGAVIKHAVVDKTNLLKRMTWGAALLLALALPGAAMAAPYAVDAAQSRIEFSGTHADQPFKGAVKSSKADIEWDAANLPGSKISVTIDAASLATGNAMYDKTLPQADWLDATIHPAITFTSTEITRGTSGVYTISGNLTVRGVTKPLSFNFTLDEPADGGTVRAQAEFVIDRLAYGVGAKSDGAAEWVSKDIGITLDIAATRR